MKKIPTLFVRDEQDRRYVTREVTPGCEWVLRGEGTPTRKYDGTCVMFDGSTCWTRREVKPGKGTPQGFIEVEHDPITGKRVGWEPWSQSGFATFINEARGVWGEEHPLPDGSHSSVLPGTYELIGPKINGNPEKVGRHLLLPHSAAERLDLPERTFDTIAAYLAGRLVFIEGIVFHHPDGRMAKIKSRDFPSSSA